ncbi:hypothetical protein [Natronococcus jeotgali]|uniref:hypothetical protein n=1 Tax=Natronococcus jeotgali TaxID=413812 RepID=UPI0019554199|nr:hypothetical protein [Natronococcus jeotgali]
MSKPDEPQSDETHQQSTSVEDEHPLEWNESPNNRKSKSERQAISKREEKNDARKIVTGESKYTADYALNFPDLAEAAVLRSDIAHG